MTDLVFLKHLKSSMWSFIWRQNRQRWSFLSYAKELQHKEAVKGLSRDNSLHSHFTIMFHVYSSLTSSSSCSDPSQPLCHDSYCQATGWQSYFRRCDASWVFAPEMYSILFFIQQELTRHCQALAHTPTHQHTHLQQRIIIGKKKKNTNQMWHSASRRCEIYSSWCIIIFSVQFCSK